jgi:threonine-phosphate decarboxylase
MARLAQLNISIRDCRNFAGLEENYFRFALRTPAENDRLLAELLPTTCASEATLRTQPFQRNFTHPPFH